MNVRYFISIISEFTKPSRIIRDTDLHNIDQKYYLWFHIIDIRLLIALWKKWGMHLELIRIISFSEYAKQSLINGVVAMKYFWKLPKCSLIKIYHFDHHRTSRAISTFASSPVNYWHDVGLLLSLSNHVKFKIFYLGNPFTKTRRQLCNCKKY